VTINEASTLQFKKTYRKGCQVFVVHMEEEPKDKVSSVEDYAVLKDFVNVFEEISRLTLKRDIDFSINLVPGAMPISNTPYRMSTLELKD
jgi:hypothetical protein